jgi:hypothetical protein
MPVSPGKNGGPLGKQEITMKGKGCIPMFMHSSELLDDA